MTALAEEARNFPGSWEISDRVQQGLMVSWIALALNMDGETVKGWLASGALPRLLSSVACRRTGRP